MPDYVERGDCADAERRRVWSATCPRCQEVAGAGVCPAPGTLSDFMLLFNRTFVLCFGSETCPRHERGYWPRAVHERMTVIDGKTLDARLSRHLGPKGAALLGILASNATVAAHRHKKKAPYWVRIARHRVLALLATLKVIEQARAANLQNALILEGDVRPVPRNALDASEIAALRRYLSTTPWEVVRPSGYFFDFAQYRAKGGAAACPAQCRCERPGGLRRACVVRRALPPRGTAPRGRRSLGQGGALDDGGSGAAAGMPLATLEARCDVRDTVAFAVHARTFATFRRVRRGALDALAQIAAAASAAEAAADAQAEDLYPANASFGWPSELFNARLPWFDKYLPARFDTLYVLPSLVVQQVRQGDESTSRAFRTKCMVVPDGARATRRPRDRPAPAI